MELSAASRLQESIVKSGRILQVQIGSYGSASAGHGYDASRSNPTQMTGQFECKWVVKSTNYPRVYLSPQVTVSGRCVARTVTEHRARLKGLGRSALSNGGAVNCHEDGSFPLVTLDVIAKRS